MRGWRTKFVFLLIVYFSGFATAIYFLAPVSPDCQMSEAHKDKLRGMIDSERLATAMNSGMHKAASLSKEIAERASVLIRERINEMQARETQTDRSEW